MAATGASTWRRLPAVKLASILPGIDATGVQIPAGETAIALVNGAINVAAPPALLVTTSRWSTSRMPCSVSRDFELGIGVFLAFTTTTIIWPYDAVRPV